MIKKLMLLFAFLFSLSYAYSQDRTITGKVVDETGATLPGATVVLKGTQKATVTDVDGNYKISVPSTGGVLLITYVGYAPQEIQIGTNDVINANMEPEVQSLDQVVVVGYGVQKKSLVTGSISKVESKDITSMPVTRIEQALQGKTSGVYIAQSSGTPGGAMSIKIRGNSSEGKNNPIYIVDGIKTSSIDFISPNDIESMEILKDAASCAIYGAEGGNGVVIITTKTGKSGSSTVEYNYQHGWQTVANTIKMMNAKQYRSYLREAAAFEKDKKTSKLLDAVDTAQYTDWMDLIFNQAPVDEHNVTFSSGTEKNTFLLSASYRNQDGIVGGDKSNFTRYTFRLNGSSKLNKWLSVGGNASYTKSKKNNLTENTDFFGGIISSAMYFDPTVPIFYDTAKLPGIYVNDPIINSALVRDGKGRIYHNSDLTKGDVGNPMALIENTHSTTEVNKILADIHGDIKFFNWLKLTSKLGLDFSLTQDDNFGPKWYYSDDQFQTNDSAVYVDNVYNKYYKISFENYVTFDHSFGDHSIQAMLGMSYEDASPSFLYARQFGVPYGNKQYATIHDTYNYRERLAVIDGGPGSISLADFYSTQTPRNNFYGEVEKQNSYFGRIGYNYKEKYLLQANFRRDGSSLFGPKNRYGFFPSFSAGWNISKESFFTDNISFINTLKLRGSWGQNGNKQILKAFGYTSLMSITGVYAQKDGFAYGAIPDRPGNDNYKWETSQQLDLGLEAGLLKNKVVFSFDYFDKRTKDQLGEKASVYDLMGYTAKPYENNGEVKNNGYEFDATWRESNKQFSYTLNFNATRLYNKVLKYGSKGTFKDGYKMNTGAIVTRYEAGFPVYYFRGFKAIGIFQDSTDIATYGTTDPVSGNFTPYVNPKLTQPGDVKYADVAGKDADGNVVMKPDGKLDETDRVMIGDPNPDWMFGLNFSCEFKGFDLGLFFQGVTGNQIFYSAIRNDRGTYNKPEYFFENRWTKPGSSNKYPRATIKDSNGNFTASSLSVSDGDYLRLKSLSLGYTLPKSLTSKVGISRLRIYGNATNLLTFTKYKGTDPEIGQMDYTTNNSYGIDRGLYPSARTYTVGVNVNF